MFARVLVPLDFSPPSDAALAYARTVAAAFGSALHLLHVVERNLLLPIAHDAQTVDAAAMLRIRNRLVEEDYRRFHVFPAVERSEKASEAIVAYARAQGIDLIVMGTHGRTGIAHVLIGSVAEQVVRSAPCPVLTLPGPRSGPGKTGPGPARILVPTDFSPPSEAALACARVLASRFGASLQVLHVLNELAPGPLGAEVPASDLPGIRGALLSDARKRLGRQITGEDHARLGVTTEAVFGPAARTIVEYAADNQSDLIVMGTHGRTGMAHLLIGSVAEAVVRTASCPVVSTHAFRAGAWVGKRDRSDRCAG